MSRAALAAVLCAVAASPATAQWTQGEPGGVWVKSALFWQRTDEEFGASGERRKEFTGGEANSRAVFTDVILGVLPTVDLWLQIPYLDLTFTSPTESLHTDGFGDARAWLRWQAVTLGRGSTPISLRVGAKAPLGFAPIDAQLIPIGEGQWDLEVFGEVGHSFWPAPAYAQAWLGYRVRLRDAEALKDPGDEAVFLVEAGGSPTAATLLKATLDGFVGGRWTVEGVRTSTSRKIVTLQVGGAIQPRKPVWLELDVRLPLAGRDFPAGAQYVVGLFAALRPGG